MNITRHQVRRLAVTVAAVAITAAGVAGVSSADTVVPAGPPAKLGPVDPSIPQAYNSRVDDTGLPGTPVQYPDDVVSIQPAYGVSQRITPVILPDGQLDPNDLPAGWNTSLPLRATGKNVTGQWSANILRPNPATGKSSFAFFGNSEGQLTATVQRKFRVKAISAEPVTFSVVRVGDQAHLAVSYQLSYAAQRFTHGDVNGIQLFDIPSDDDPWTLLGDDEVTDLHRLGVPIPTP